MAHRKTKLGNPHSVQLHQETEEEVYKQMQNESRSKNFILRRAIESYYEPTKTAKKS